MAAGFALGFTAAIAKPQLVIGIAAYMIGRRDWRAVGGALAGAAVTMAIGLVGAGPRALGSFVTAIATPSNSPTAQMQGTSGLFGSLLGHAPGVFLLAVGGRDRRGCRGRMARNGRSSPSRSLRAVALRRRGAVAVRVSSSARTRPDAAGAGPRRGPGLAGRPTRRAARGRAGHPRGARASGCCSRLRASATCPRTPSASRAERPRGCCCSPPPPGARSSSAPPVLELAGRRQRPRFGRGVGIGVDRRS